MAIDTRAKLQLCSRAFREYAGTAIPRYIPVKSAPMIITDAGYCSIFFLQTIMHLQRPYYIKCSWN
jgi:hypothetical protein